MTDLIGQTLGQYKLTARLGRGGMADVYKAFHTGLSIYRAIKVIRPEFVSSDDFRIRFKKEAQSVASLRHPNIVQVHDFGSEGDTFYMVMEFIEGTDLKALLKKEGRIRPISKAVDIIRQIASALDYAHKRDLIHRDIKPDNIMLNSEGLPILMDFGIAKLLTESTQLTQKGLGIGTPAYMAPEQAKAIGDLGPTADVYSLSIVLFEMLTGTQPFSADTPMAVMLKVISDPMPLPRNISSDISEALQGIILKGTAKDPNDRYPSTKLLYEALESYVDLDSEQATLVRGVPQIIASAPTEVLPKKSKSGKGRYAVIAVVLLLVAAGITYLVSKDPATAINPPPPNAAQEGPIQNGQAISTTPAQAVTKQAASVILAEYRGPTGAGVSLVESVSVSADDVLYLDVISANPITDFSLSFIVDGRIERVEGVSDIGPLTIKQAGQVRLNALTQGGAAGEIHFKFWKIVPAVIQGGTIETGSSIVGKTVTPGQTVLYDIELSKNETFIFELEKSSAEAEFTLRATDSNVPEFVSTNDFGPFQTQTTGSYVLKIDPKDSALVSYQFSFLKTDSIDKEVDQLGPSKTDMDKNLTPADSPNMIIPQTIVQENSVIEGSSLGVEQELSASDNNKSEVESAARLTPESRANPPLLEPSPNQDPSDKRMSSSARIVIASEALLDIVELRNPLFRKVGLFTQTNVQLQNLSEQALDLEYQIDWKDRDGFSVGAPNSWQFITLAAFGSVQISSLGKVQEAENVTVRVKLSE